MARILLVDDADDIRLLVRAVLQRAGHDIVEAESGAVAMALLTATDQRPDAIVLDIQMPGLDGWQTLTLLRADPATRVVPVLMCSVKSSPEDAARAWAMDCDGYLTKPFNISDLTAEVEAVTTRSLPERQAVRRTRLATALAQSQAHASQER